MDIGGQPNDAYVVKLPTLITPQGQNRAAVMISVFAEKFGLPKSRGGRHGNTDLFVGEGECPAQTIVW